MSDLDELREHILGWFRTKDKSPRPHHNAGMYFWSRDNDGNLWRVREDILDRNGRFQVSYIWHHHPFPYPPMRTTNPRTVVPEHSHPDVLCICTWEYLSDDLTQANWDVLNPARQRVSEPDETHGGEIGRRGLSHYCFQLWPEGVEIGPISLHTSTPGLPMNPDHRHLPPVEYYPPGWD